MKVALLTDAWTPVWGGGQRHIREVALILGQKFGVEVEILAPNILGPGGTVYPAIENLTPGKVRLVRVGPKFIFPDFTGRFFYTVAVFFKLIRNKYDIYHSHCYLALVLPLVKLFRPKSRYAYTLHGAGVNILGGGILNNLSLPVKIWSFLVYHYPWDLLGSAAAATVSRPVRARNFMVVGNGVEVKSEEIATRPKQTQKFLRAVWVGRSADPVKGLAVFRRAMEIVTTQGVKLEADIVSGQSEHRVQSHLQSADFLVLTSFSEGLPLIILEAMAQKLPVISTDVGDCKKIIEGSNCGLIVPAGDPVKLAQAIKDLVHRTDRKQLGQNGYNYVAQNFTWDLVAGKTYEAYQQISG